MTADRNGGTSSDVRVVSKTREVAKEACAQFPKGQRHSLDKVCAFLHILAVPISSHHPPSKPLSNYLLIPTGLHTCSAALRMLKGAGAPAQDP